MASSPKTSHSRKGGTRSAYHGEKDTSCYQRTMTFVSKDSIVCTDGYSESLNFYEHVICDQLKDGIIEEVSGSPEPTTKVHYLPFMRRDKTMTKVRVVYDASCAEGANLSLNQCLYVASKFGQSIYWIS